jgi:hypothetical protein
MTVNELHIKLQDLKIAPENYFLHGLYGSSDDDGKLSMIIKRGKYTIEYEVYLRERGEKHSVIVFTDESKACEYFLKKITESEKHNQDLNNNSC